MARTKGAMGKKTLEKFCTMFLNGEEVDAAVVKQLKCRGMVGKKSTSKEKVEKEKVAKVETAKAKIVKKAVSSAVGTERSMWKESGTGFRMQINGCTSAEASSFSKKLNVKLVGSEVMARRSRGVFLFKQEFSDTNDAKRWAKTNKFNFVK